MARHRAVLERPRWRCRSSAQTVVPVQSGPGIEVVDVLTRLAHRTVRKILNSALTACAL